MDENKVNNSENPSAGSFGGRIKPRPRVEDLVPIKSYRTKKAKKKKPVGMKQFFATATNFQGFPIHLCRYEPAVGDMVFVPKNHGALTKGYAWRDLSFCTSCMLQPCIMVEHQDAIQDMASDLCWAKRFAEGEGRKSRTHLEIVKKMENHATKQLRKCFGRDHKSNNHVPDCVIKGTHELHQIAKKD